MRLILPELAMEFDADHRVAIVTVPANLRANDGGVALCLLQLPASSGQTIQNDSPRAVAKAAFRNLLAGGGDHARPVIADLAPGLQPVVIVAPEYACGHDDWAEIDGLVREMQRPVVVIVGFGATPAEKVLAWACAGENHARRLAWDPDAYPLSAVRPVNGAWCWVHGFGPDTTCVVTLKNHMEQGTELAGVEWIQAGDHHLRLAFQDVDLFPLICADLVQTLADGPVTAARRIRSHLEAAGPSDRPVLVTGCLEQLKPGNANWAIAIDVWLNQITLSRPALMALANVSIDKPDRDEALDRWRSLTGVFSRMTAFVKNQKPLRVSRNVATDNVRGAVLRHTEPYVACGVLRWPPYGPTGDQYYWHAPLGAPVAPDGIVAPIARPPEIADAEFARFLRRAPPEDGWRPCVGTGLDGIQAHLVDGGMPAGRDLLSTLLTGVSRRVFGHPDELHQGGLPMALTHGLHSLATLVSAPETAWRTDPKHVGQLDLPDQRMNLLVWRDSELNGLQMRHALSDWAGDGGPHPPLVVVAAGPRTAPEEGLVTPHPRDNIAAGPQTAEGLQVEGGLLDDPKDITQRRARRQVACVRLDRVAEVYEQSDALTEAADLKALVDRLSSAFDPESAS